MAAAEIGIGESAWIDSTSQAGILRFTTAGSVDDGKSTLIGRLLYDSKGVYEDQLASVRKATRNQTVGGLDLSLLTDGLRAEREQGITIDVAYRYFSTARRKFIIADTPGHVQYTRNMATGASTADLAVVLIDARHGVLPQSRRHAYIAALLGVPHIAVAVNKMDLVHFREDVFLRIREEFARFADRLELRNVLYMPISALEGDNVVSPSARMPWWAGPSLLEYLETVPITTPGVGGPLRFPVQYVIRPNLDFRGFAGQVSGGEIRRGGTVTVLPSGRSSRVKSIVTWGGELDAASAPMSVTVCLDDEIDISRGDMLVDPARPPVASRRFDAAVVWMNEKPLEPRRPYLLKHTTQMVQARVREIRHRVNIETLDHQGAAELRLNEIGVVSIEAHRPLFFDPYRLNRATGGFILIDPITNETVGAGMIVAAAAGDRRGGCVTAQERESRNGHKGAVVRLDSDPELAALLERRLFDRGCQVTLVSAGAALASLSAAGLIVIAVTTEEAGFRRADLPEDREEAVEAICRALAARGILESAEPGLEEGAGI